MIGYCRNPLDVKTIFFSNQRFSGPYPHIRELHIHLFLNFQGNCSPAGRLGYLVTRCFIMPP